MSSTPKSRPFPFRRNLSLSLAAAVALVLGNQGAQADTLTWDGTSSTAFWNTTATNWLNSGTPAVWNNALPDSAIFGGTGFKTVTLGADMTVGNLTFNAAGYEIAGGGNTLTLSNTIISGTQSATISANLGGSGLTITNTGGITLTGTNTYSGTTTVGSGTSSNSDASVLRIKSVGALGNSTDIRVGNGSALIIEVPNSTSTSVGSGKTVTLYGNGPGNNGALQGATGIQATWAGDIVIGSGGARISGGSNGTLTISGVISGNSSSPITFNRIGGSTTVLNAVNTYTGDTSLFNDATTTTSTLKIGVDNAIHSNSRLTALNATAKANAVLDLNGHVLTLRGLDTSLSQSATSSAFLIVKNDGGAASTLTVGDSVAANTSTFGGLIQNGNGGMSLVKIGTNTQILVGTNTYTGSTTVNGGTLQVGAPTPTSGNVHYTGASASLASTDIRLNNGTFVIDNTGTNNNSGTRLSDSANFTLNTGTFTYKGSESATSQETLGKFTFASGVSTINLVHGASNTAVVTAGELSRSTGGGIGFISGADFGSTGASASRLIVSTAPTLVGTTDALATGAGTAKDTKIVPFLLASTTNGAITTADTFVTYNPTTGLRPLSTTEFESSIVAGSNTRISGATATDVSADTAINSLIVTGATLDIKTFTLTNTSGAFLFTNTTSNINNGTLALGNAEGIMTVSGTTAVIGSKITGSNGLSFFGPGTLGLGSTQSTYTGETMLYSGLIVPQVSSKGSGETLTGPFGRSTVVFAGSQIRTSTSMTSSAPTIGNAVRVQADTTFTSGNYDLTFSGPVTLKGGIRTLTNSSGNKLTFTGGISGTLPGDGLSVAGTGTSSVILSGTNTYTGPTTVKSSKLEVSGSIAASSALTVQNSGSFLLSGNNPSGFDRISDSAPVTLGTSGASGNARFAIDNSTASAPFQETVGTLTLLSNSILDLGAGTNGTLLHFADSSSGAWTGTLSIYNWSGTAGTGGGTDQLFFGIDQHGLTADQLSRITFYGEGDTLLGGGMLLSNGELVLAPVPEPSTIFCGLAMLGMIGWRERRRFRRKATVES